MRAPIATGRWAGLVIDSPIMPGAINLLWMEHGRPMIEAYQPGVDGRFYFVGIPGGNDEAPPAPQDAAVDDKSVVGTSPLGALREATPIDTSDLDGLAIRGSVTQMPILPACHPAAAIYVRYDSNDKVLILRCSQCERFATKIRVGYPFQPSMSDSAFFEAGMQRYGLPFVEMLNAARRVDGPA